MRRLETPERPLETPERALTRLPRRPGPMAQRVYCKCGNWIGEQDGEWLFVVYRGREQTGRTPAEIRCEKCGKRTTVN